MINKNLGLIFQPAKRIAMDNPVPIPLKCCSERVLILFVSTSSGVFTSHCIGCKSFFLHFSPCGCSSHLTISPYQLQYKYEIQDFTSAPAYCSLLTAYILDSRVLCHFQRYQARSRQNSNPAYGSDKP